MSQIIEMVRWNAGWATALALVVFAAGRLPAFRRRPAVMHLLWFGVLLRLVAPSLVDLAILPDEPRLALIQSRTAAQSQTASAHPESLAVPSGPSQPDVRHATIADGLPVPTAPFRLPLVLLSVSLAGTVVLLARSIFRGRRIVRLLAESHAAPSRLTELAEKLARGMGSSAPPLLRVTRGIASPSLWTGVRRATILLPQPLVDTLSDDQWSCILAHELAHLARRDHWFNLAASAALQLDWWNPIAWWAWREMQAAQEACCDAMAISNEGLSRRLYAETLLQVVDSWSRTAVSAPQPGLAFTRSVLTRRFEMIANRSVRPSMAVLARLCLALAGLSFICVPVRAEKKEQGSSNLTKSVAEGEAASRAPTTRAGKNEAADDSVVDRHFVVFPVKTPLQRHLMGWSADEAAAARVYVGIDGMAVVDDAGLIDESALDLEALREAIAPFADPRNGTVFLHLNFNVVPARNRNAEQLVAWGLEGFGRNAGFKTARAYSTYFNDRSFDWEKKLAAVRDRVAGRADEPEDPIGDELVKVYAVRTAFSAFLTSADCVVEILTPPNVEGEGLLPLPVRAAVVKYVAEAKPRDKQSIVFGVKLGGLPRNPPRKQEQLFQELDELAKSLGFERSSVSSR